MTRGKQRQSGFRGIGRHFVEDIMQASDDEILAQYAEDIGEPEANAARMRAMVERTVLLANKDRLHAARAGASANKTTQPQPVIPIAEARERLRQALASNAHDDNFTLAARKETELSDADVLDMLQAMRELGIIK